MILQGLYPESHGIVNNVFYDQHLNEIFTLGRPMTFDPRWWGGEPVSDNFIFLCCVEDKDCCSVEGCLK